MGFSFARSFNSDISKWKVSRVANMDFMFQQAAAFTQTLCGAAWFNSKASKTHMFLDSPGSISKTCTPTEAIGSLFSPRSHTALQNAVHACLRLSRKGDCATGPHGPIGDWDVSHITEMRYL